MIFLEISQLFRKIVKFSVLALLIGSHAFSQSTPSPSKKVTRSINSEKEMQTLLAQGQLLSNQGKYQEAVLVLRKVTSLHPSNALAWSELGFAAVSSHQLPLALDATKKAIQLSREKNLLAASLYNLGLIQEAQGEKQKALLSYQRSYYDRNNPIVQEKLQALLSELTLPKVHFPALRAAPPIAENPSPVLPVFLEGPYQNEQQFWKKREKECKKELQEEDDDRIPQFSHKQADRIDPKEGGIIDLSLEVNLDSIVSMVEESCLKGETDFAQGYRNNHVFYQIKEKLYVFTLPDEVDIREKDEDDLEIKSFELKNIVPGREKELVTRFVWSRLRRSPGINLNEGEEHEALFLVGIGPSGRPSVIPPLLFRMETDSGKEREDKAGPPEKTSEFKFQYRFLHDGILEIKKGTKKTGELNVSILGKHPIRFL